MEATVILVTWNNLKLTAECLKSLQKQNFKDFKILLLDNASTDQTPEFIKVKFPSVQVIKLKKNLGFSKAVNEGIKISNTEYIILINNDTVLDKNFISYLIKFLDKNKKYCACTSKMINMSDRKTIAAAGDFMNDVGQSFSRGLGDGIDKWDKPDEVFLITGGASIFRRKVFEDVGYFDEDFFIYGEDTDWCFRAQLMGYKFFYEPKAIIFHHCKASSEKINKIIDYFHYRNMKIIIIKNFPLKLFFKKWRFIKIPLVQLHMAFYLLIQGNFFQVLSADFWIIKNIFKLIKKRNLIQAKRKVTVNYINNWLQPKKIRLLNE
jgi:GT2 family glycosyltransferase